MFRLCHSSQSPSLPIPGNLDGGSILLQSLCPVVSRLSLAFLLWAALRGAPPSLVAMVDGLPLRQALNGAGSRAPEIGRGGGVERGNSLCGFCLPDYFYPSRPNFGEESEVGRMGRLGGITPLGRSFPGKICFNVRLNNPTTCFVTDSRRVFRLFHLDLR